MRRLVVSRLSRVGCNYFVSNHNGIRPDHGELDFKLHSYLHTNLDLYGHARLGPSIVTSVSVPYTWATRLRARYPRNQARELELDELNTVEVRYNMWNAYSPPYHRMADAVFVP